MSNLNKRERVAVYIDGSNFYGYLKDEINKWLEEEENVKVVSIGQSESFTEYGSLGHGRVSITIFYKD